MVGLSTIRNNENSIMNYQSTLFEDVYESLINNEITINDAFEIIKESNERGIINDDEVFEILEGLIGDGLITEDDLNDF